MLDLRLKNKKLTEEQKIDQRRKLIQKKLNLSLKNITNFPSSLKTAATKNCENMIGATQIPLGIAGPINIKGQHIKGDFYIPLATTEAALVASVNRGAKAVYGSGAVNTQVENIGITRAPLFVTQNLSHSQKLVRFVKKNFSQIKSITDRTSHHLKLLKIIPILVGRNVYLKFTFDSVDAMGMNMATLAVEKAKDFISKKTNCSCLSLTGNLCVDKKPSWSNFISGRGKKVRAEITIKSSLLKKVLKTIPQKIVEVNYRKNLLGSALSGSLGFNAHYANIIAAIFIATGQDPAHVVEGSLGITTAEIVNKNNLYFSVYLPDLVIGTVGGGTSLPSQKEALSILNLSQNKTKGKNVLKFAEIIVSAVLAGELSLLAALATGHLAKAHCLLAKKKNNIKKT